MNEKHIINQLFRKKFLSEEDYRLLSEKISPLPAASDWAKLLLIAGTGLILAGVIFFFAANWNQFGKVLRLLLPLLGLAGCGAGMYWKGLHTSPGQAFAFGAALFVVIFWMNFGQVYQHDAYIYQVLCMVPLCLWTRNKWLWLWTFYLAMFYCMDVTEVWLWSPNNRLVWCLLAAVGVAVWGVSVWKKAGWIFERFVWIPLGGCIWLTGWQAILNENLTHLAFYFWVSVVFWFAQGAFSIWRKDVTLFGWVLLGITGWISSWVLQYVVPVDAFGISSFLFLLTIIATYLFWRRVREN